MTTTTLEVDRDAREVFNLAAIAVGMNDAEAAFDVCRKLGELEKHYRLALRVADDAPRSAGTTGATKGGAPTPAAGNLRRISARFASRCAGCRGPIAQGAPIAYDPDSKRAFHDRCAA